MLGMMLSIRKRLGASILLTLLSIGTIFLLLPTSRVSELHKIVLGTSIDQYTDFFDWGSGDEDDEEGDGRGVRLVVFGDSWVGETVEKGLEGRGKTWPHVLCEEMGCSSLISYATSQPSSAWPEHPPTGVHTSNEIHNMIEGATSNQNLSSPSPPALSDLATQIQSFLSLPAPPTTPNHTIFLISLGLWDIYTFASLNPSLAKNATTQSISHITEQLEVLYTHYTTILYPPIPNTKNEATPKPKDPKFQIILTKIPDPSLSPGWISQRPTPLKPSSIAEEQKNAMYLTKQWNTELESSFSSWLDVPRKKIPSSSSDPDNSEAEEEHEIEKNTTGERGRAIEKEIFYYDMENTLVDLLIEHQLESQGLTDATGFGTGESPFVDVDHPCVDVIDGEYGTDGSLKREEIGGMVVCGNKGGFLWWDAWRLGSVVNRVFGLEVAEMVAEGRGLRAKWDAEEG